MDFNHSTLSGYQPHNTRTKHQTSEAPSSLESSKIREQSISSETQSLKQPDLKDGQLLKGQVIDHRFNEVKIQLEPSKQIIKAKLAGDVSLSIGQEATFQISEDQSKQLVLKYIPDQTTTPTDATVQKALLASNLPMTDRNKALATELLNHRMPLDKQTLQNLIRLSHQNKEASPLTLVLLYKYKIPMTASNIKQFEAYQNGTHQLLNDMKAISQNIAGVFRKADVLTHDLILPEAALSKPQSNQNMQGIIQSYASSGTSTPADIMSPQQAVLNNNKLIDILYPNSNTSLDASTMPINNLFNQQELSSLSDLIEQKLIDTSGKSVDQSLGSSAGLSPELLQQISKGSLSLVEAAKLMEHINNNTTTLSDNMSPGNTNEQVMERVIHKLQNTYEQIQDNTPSLASLLGETERTSLLQYITDMPMINDLKDRIEQGTATLKETLHFIQNQLSNVDLETAGKLLSSSEYAKLLEEALLNKWTVTPEEAAKKNSVDELYQQLQKDLEQLTTLNNSIRESGDLRQIQEPIKNMQDNLQFMKHLNDAFTYLQLPVQFKDQKGHTDLYVLTRKKALSDKNEAVSVLLHLDMTNLGSLNVHIQLAKDQLQTTFYMEDTKAGELLKQHLSSFIDAFEKKGYHIRAEVKNEYKKPDFCKDFIEQNSQDHHISQFTFDIRT